MAAAIASQLFEFGSIVTRPQKEVVWIITIARLELIPEPRMSGVNSWAVVMDGIRHPPWTR